MSRAICLKRNVTFDPDEACYECLSEQHEMLMELAYSLLNTHVDDPDGIRRLQMLARQIVTAHEAEHIGSVP